MKNASMNVTNPLFRRCFVVSMLCVLTACSTAPRQEQPSHSDETTEPEQTTVQANISWQPAWHSAGVVWHSRSFPGKKTTRYTAATLDGREVIQSEALSSASMMRQAVRIEPAALGQISFAWKVPQLIAGADMGLRDHDDSPVRVMLAFEGERSRLSMKNAMLSELARTLTGEEMPYATLMYVWCNSRVPGSVIISPRTDRIRSIVMESGPQRLNQWLDYQRDIQADYELAFGEKPGALVGVAIMSDSDNTSSDVRAWYGAVRITPASLGQAAQR